MELAAEVLERYVAGESGVRIAESLGLAQSSLYGVLEACAVLRSHAEATRVRQAGGQRPAGKVQAGLPAEQAVTQYLAGDPPRIIGRALGVSPTRVYLTLRERGVVRTRSEARMLAAGVRQLPEGWEAVVVERYVAGDSGPAIAAGLGVPVRRVYAVLHERGVLRSPSEARKLDEARRRAAKTAAEGQEPGPAAPAGAKPKSWSWPAELADLIEERYSAGESGEAIAADLGVGQSRVYALLRERGVLRTLSQASLLREERRRRAS